jgi:hypothetical protein
VLPSFLRDWLWKRRLAESPVVIRVRDRRGKPCSSVRIEGLWLPSGRSFTANPMVADGLCMLPWAGGERRLEMVVVSGGAQAKIAFDRRHRDPHRAHELRLA